MVNTQENTITTNKKDKGHLSSQQRRGNNNNILEIQKFDTTEYKSKNVVSSPKSERETFQKYNGNQVASRKVLDTPGKRTGSDIYRHGSPTLAKTNLKVKSNENKRKGNFSEEYNHRRKCWEKVINNKIAETKKKQTPDLKNVMNSKVAPKEAKDTNKDTHNTSLAKKHVKKPNPSLSPGVNPILSNPTTPTINSTILGNCTLLNQHQTSRAEKKETTKDKETNGSAKNSTSISKVRQILSTYRKKIRSGGSMTTFAGGKPEGNPTLLHLNMNMNFHANNIDNSNCCVNNLMHCNHNNNGINSTGRQRHRASNSNGNMCNLISSPVVSTNLNANSHFKTQVIRNNLISNKNPDDSGNIEFKDFASNSMEGITIPTEKRFGKHNKNNLIKLNLNSKLLNNNKEKINPINSSGKLVSPMSSFNNNFMMSTVMHNNSNALNNLNLPIFNQKDTSAILNSNISKNNVLNLNKCKFDYLSSPKQIDKNLNNSSGSMSKQTNAHLNKAKVTPNKKKGSSSKLNTNQNTNKKKNSKDDNSLLHSYGLKTQSDKNSLFPNSMLFLDDTILESQGDLRVISTDLNADLNNEVFKLKKRYDNEFKDVSRFFDNMITELIKTKENVLSKVNHNQTVMIKDATSQMNKFSENLNILDRIIDCVNRNEKKVTQEDYGALKTIIEDLKVTTTHKNEYEKINYLEFENAGQDFKDILDRAFSFVSINRDISKIMMFNSQVHTQLTRLLNKDESPKHNRQQSIAVDNMNYGFNTIEKVNNKSSLETDCQPTKATKFIKSREIDFDYETEMLFKTKNYRDNSSNSKQYFSSSDKKKNNALYNQEYNYDNVEISDFNRSDKEVVKSENSNLNLDFKFLQERNNTNQTEPEQDLEKNLEETEQDLYCYDSLRQTFSNNDRGELNFYNVNIRKTTNAKENYKIQHIETDYDELFELNNQIYDSNSSKNIEGMSLGPLKKIGLITKKDEFGLENDENPDNLQCDEEINIHRKPDNLKCDEEIDIHRKPDNLKCDEEIDIHRKDSHNDHYLAMNYMENYASKKDYFVMNERKDSFGETNNFMTNAEENLEFENANLDNLGFGIGYINDNSNNNQMTANREVMNNYDAEANSNDQNVNQNSIEDNMFDDLMCSEQLDPIGYIRPNYNEDDDFLISQSLKNSNIININKNSTILGTPDFNDYLGSKNYSLLDY